MKKTFDLNRKSFILFFLIQCLFLFLTSCGLDSYVVVKAPLSTGKEVSYTTSDFSNMYFEFNTNEDPGGYYPKDFTFLGTEVYYKIYSNYSTMTSEVTTLKTLAGSSETSAKAPERLINSVSSGGFGYQTLKMRNNLDSPLIPAKSTNYQKVYIRLTNYQALDAFSAKVVVNDVYVGIPVRVNNDYSFDFGRTATFDKIPSSTDSDVKYSTTSSAGNWYVAMFAVSVGRDVSYSNQYSNILYLGSVTISSKKADN